MLLVARFVTGVARQLAKAAAAASTAAFASSADDDWKRPTRSRISAGFVFSNVRPVRLAAHSPAMQFLNSSADMALIWRVAG